MKMEHQIRADRNGTINSISVSENEIIVEGHPLVFIEEGDIGELNFEAEDHEYYMKGLKDYFTQPLS